MNTEMNKLTETVIGAAIEVHRDLGPGLLESAYQRALEHELTLRGIRFVAQRVCPITYKGLLIEDAYRLDLLVENKLVVELKAVDALADVHEAQVLTYLKFSGCQLDLLVNFRSRWLKDGVRRLAL
ncbi:MAG: GxxExxY protein [Verrucomicrobia bacterium]|nr:GxxExxY protein [Verrucomicrobiota bacterium]